MCTYKAYYTYRQNETKQRKRRMENNKYDNRTGIFTCRTLISKTQVRITDVYREDGEVSKTSSWVKEFKSFEDAWEFCGE